MKRLVLGLAICITLAPPLAAQMAGFGGSRAVPVVQPANVVPAIGPGVVVNIGGSTPREAAVGLPLRRRFNRQQVFLPGFYGGFYGYDSQYTGAMVYEAPPETSLPQPAQPVFEERAPSAPLIIEKVGDQWVRRRVVESDEGPQYRDEQPQRPCQARNATDSTCRK